MKNLSLDFVARFHQQCGGPSTIIAMIDSGEVCTGENQNGQVVIIFTEAGLARFMGWELDEPEAS